MKGFITYATYKVENGSANIYLFGRLENSESFMTVNSYKPYFFIKKDDVENSKEVFVEVKYEIEESDFINFKEEPLAKVTLNNPKEVPMLRKAFEDNNIVCFEADIRFVYRFLIDHEIKGALNIEGDFKKGELVNRIYNEPKLSGTEFFPELKTISIDIETNRDASKIYSIAMYGSSIRKVLILSPKKHSNAESFATEKELLEGFKKIILEEDPDILTGWNFIDFDLKVIENRCKELKTSFSLGRTNWPSFVRINDSFMRDSDADIPGRFVADSISLLKASFIKLQDYKLETAAQAMLKESKLIAFVNKPEEIEKLHKENPERLIEYNLKDAELVYRILYEKGIMELVIERSLLTGMVIERVKASIASLDSLYLRETRKLGIVCNSTHYDNKYERIKGGFVRDSIPGIYSYVNLFDFKSLYPSIIRTFNIDPISYSPEGTIVTPNGAKFLNKDGILPMLIQRLWEQRDKAKRERNKIKSNAIKITMNSFFGVLANPMCRFFNLEMANAITSSGQHIIKLTAEKFEERGYKVIYGDSVGKDSEIIIQDNDGKISFKKISELFEKIDKSSLRKEYDFKKDIKTLTIDDSGNSVFKPIKYVMRHEANKRMFRVHLTNYWHLDVTEDHSLIGYQSQAFNNSKERSNPLKRIIEIKPTELKRKANSLVVLKNIPEGLVISKKYPAKVYEFMGYFVGDGSFQRNKSQQKYNKDYYLRLSLGSDAEEVFNELIRPLTKMGFVKSHWWSKTRKGDLTINGLKLVKIISENCRDSSGKKIIPEWLFEESEENICAFLRGLFSADGCVMIRNNSPIIKFTSIRDDYVEKVSKLLFRIGVSHSTFKENSINKFNDRHKKKTFSSGSQSRNILLKNRELFVEHVGFLIERKNDLASIKTNPVQRKFIKNYDFELSSTLEVEEIKYDDYVYDLEVEGTHRFFANRVLVHNTDSIFIETKANSMEESATIGELMKNDITAFYVAYVKKYYDRKSFLELEYEKTFLKFLMPKIRDIDVGAKKRYAGLVVKDGKETIEFTGLEFVRRDWTEASKRLQLELLDRVFHQQELTKFIKNFVADLKDGKYDDQLVYRKELTKSIEFYTKTTPPHVKAARLMPKLDTSIIFYVMTTNGPEPVEYRKGKIDYNHYIEKQIKPIADAILSFYGMKFDEIISGSKQESLLNF